ncbi:hypothetical protein COCSUDRAFT_83459 [Coccomyxa subellipsoidea C-169]|uniref:KANL3/Tex30 alpha/beta hydrolase-like domain-containing protein n=1 Tax=Coccomyxa subellipsoidea (strain C-169) TaxID=574566 RepID=I0ZB20_COCSC|nr:hypothetical protein COCSUDRAFT_83459 [Coccomyxa subellipsoidea C-169]EIE27839.1 hypothetical protein COCSUDRAFT_83459 [Coccomyxa subellipsoidea C-169]|eukprot:XP_005652383.1 hypothetical protein COCSUDRAFT_83459 [Coccomyxa subellipsoidea C-169]
MVAGPVKAKAFIAGGAHVLSGLQDQLREDPLTSLTAPILFVRGTNDNFCNTKEFESVKARMTSSDVQVHTVETGDHSLKARGGKQAAAAAVDAAIQAAVAFAQTLADADADQQAEGPSVQEAKKRKDVGEKTDETDTVTHTRKRQRKTRPRH